MKILYSLSLFLMVSSLSFAQVGKEKVSFVAEDGIEITADKYLVNEREEPYVRQMMSSIPEDGYTIFQPDKSGVHGARALWEDNPSKDEYWLALLMFINNLNK